MASESKAGNALALTQSLKTAARELGFCFAGVCPAVSPPGYSRLQAWIEAGMAGTMEYIPRRLPAYQHPSHVMDGVVSLLMLGLNYAPPSADSPKPPVGHGQVARYARGMTDYHDLVRDRLNRLAGRAAVLSPGIQARGVVDTAPLLEREFAALAGVGWQGKNTMLIHPRAGSWFFLGALLVDRELVPDQPLGVDHCGTCTACLKACPTDAFVQPRVLDARRCISYLTIELKGPIPPELRPGIGDWLFGCDICQEVCPWNRFATPSPEPGFQPVDAAGQVDLAGLFCLDPEQFRARFRSTPLWRARRRGILRNAAIVLGNQRSSDAIPALARGLSDDDPVIRGAAAWALGQIGSAEATRLLAERRGIETDASVMAELDAALAGPGPGNAKAGTPTDA